MQQEEPPVARFMVRHPELSRHFWIFFGIILTLAGGLTVFHLLTAPMPRSTSAENPAMCYPPSSWLSPSEDIDLSGDIAPRITRDHCDRARQRQTANAILIAVPTTIVGSVTTTAIVFRRRLLTPLPAPEKKPDPDEAS